MMIVLDKLCRRQLYQCSSVIIGRSSPDTMSPMHCAVYSYMALGYELDQPADLGRRGRDMSRCRQRTTLHRPSLTWCLHQSPSQENTK